MKIERPDLGTLIIELMGERAAREQSELSGFPFIGGGTVGPWTFATNAITEIINGNVDFGSGTFKMVLCSSASNIGTGSTTYSALTGELSTAYGYTSGGETLTMSVSGTNPVIVDCADVIWNASGGPIAARYAVIYLDNGGTGLVICYSLLDTAPADVSAADGNPLTIAVANIFQASV